MRIKKFIKNLLGVKDFMTEFEIFCNQKYVWAGKDDIFNTLYNEACKTTDIRSFLPHKMRSYMLQFLASIAPEKGEVVECGVYKGVTAYQIQKITGKTVHLFDSFEGISPRTEADAQYPEQIGTGAGSLVFPLGKVQENLGTKFFKYYPGWIPQARQFEKVKDLKFSFVHIDLDVEEPTRASFDFFYPRMVTGGIMICDDYGFIQWPGAKKAVDAMAEKYGFRVIPQITGQCFVIK